MRKVLFAGVLSLAGTLCAPNDVDAGWRQRSRTVTVATASGPVTAEAKANAQAAAGVMRHTGPIPAGAVEGVGYSSVSAADALARCCYSNSGLPLLSQAVARGRNGWYAVRHFAATSTRAVVAAPLAVVRKARETCAGPNCPK